MQATGYTGIALPVHSSVSARRLELGGKLYDAVGRVPLEHIHCYRESPIGEELEVAVVRSIPVRHASAGDFACRAAD